MVVFLASQTKQPSTLIPPQQAPTNITYTPPSLCLTASCIQMANAFLESMNQSAQPCEDFHEFVCGRWVRSNIVPKGYSGWSIPRELSRKNLIVLKSLLETTPLVASSDQLVNSEAEAIKFYRACMNLSEIEQRQSRPLHEFFEKNLNMSIKDWIQLDSNNEIMIKDLFVRLTHILSIKYGFTYFMPISIAPDDKNSTYNNIHVSLNQPQLGLESRDYYINSSLNNKSDPDTDTRNKIIRETYAKVGVELLKLLSFNETEAKQRVEAIIEFERELAVISLPMEILQRPNETYYLMTLKELQSYFNDTHLDLYKLFNEYVNVNSSNNIILGDNDQFIVLSLEFVSNLAKVLSSYLNSPTKRRVVIDHYLFSLVFDVGAHLSTEFEKAQLPLLKELYGVEEQPNRWEHCVTETDNSFGYYGGIGSLYVKAVFNVTDRSKANELITNIRLMFEQNLQTLTWIDEPSRKEAIKKLKKITEKIGYPDFIHDKVKSNERYAGYSMFETEYFNNVIRVFERERRRIRLKYRKKVDKADWSMTPRTVNAYYAPQGNEIVFPAGILQPPFFHKDLPVSINYGAIGTVIGHEVTHGFDDQGREYDSDGNMRTWWTKDALDKFEEKTKCFINQYSKYALDGQNENGQRTLSENIADNGGVKLAYLAYELQKQKNSESNLLLPGLSYNGDQLFFIAFAHNWCNLETKNAQHYDLINDPHSPAKYRIIGTMANSDEFLKAFSCSKTSTKSSLEKCQLW
ncbi:unnamed protein product [Didymodactylos carnosus]|uniref:Endothelin-converting enzyme 1 n=1 Tax=Didymodactylos carnosus TaxID=1234261 RepID=A0A814SLF9_9BILA|nr:unnamed protein product [Didymodactylos carnosus]CAF3909924.1 unnamed protein product [Didymodactylos carnosus]